MKPRVAFLVGNFPGLSATFIINQVTGLMDRGWDVTIFALRNPGEKKVQPDVVRYGLVEKTRYFGLPQSKVKRLAGAAKIVAANLFAFPGQIAKSLSPWFFPGETLRLNTPYYLAPFLNESFDILLCHFGPNGLIGALLKGLGISGHLVTVFHGYDLSSFLRGRSDSVYKKLFHYGDLFLPVSQHWAEKLVQMGCEREKIHVHYMGIDLDRFVPRHKMRREGDMWELLTVGRLMPKKGHASVLEALRDFDARPPWRYTIVGDGVLRPELEQMAGDFGIRDRLRFTGALNEDEIMALYREADIFLLPSVTAADGDCEGIPMVLMEAMAMELPVISTLHSGIPELVVHERTGILVDEHDAEGIRIELARLMRDKDLRHRLGVTGRKRVAGDFNLTLQNDRLDALLRSIVR